ncbi:hypothetical protein D5S17_16530 [Pseudonocardiaceae bacterium YIM PH 21723]|nr:hypothetical protein D5S17_16530 [Pseudonocardiaceae bacterium YIM PH 21723]
MIDLHPTSITKWSSTNIDRPLHLLNETAKDIFVALCIWDPNGTADDTLGTGWVHVRPRATSTLAIPVPRLGSARLALYARSRKNKRQWTGSGPRGRQFAVLLPADGERLDDHTDYRLRGAASMHTRVLSRRGGLERLERVTGQLVEMTGSYTYRFRWAEDQHQVSA